MGLFKKKNLYDLLDASEKHGSLHPTLNARQLIMLGIGAIIGAGLFSITGIAAAEHGGPAILISFIIAAIGCTFCGLCYSELCAMAPSSGSAYTYTYTTMGQFFAWLIGWNLILEYAIGAATVAVSWSAYIVSFLHGIGVHLPTALIASPWQPVKMPDGAVVYGDINLPAVLIVLFLSLLLIRGLRQSVKFNNFIIYVKLAVIILFIVGGIWYVKLENYAPFIPENTGEWGKYGISGILNAAGIIFFAYIGFDAVSTTAKEAINPERTVPIGIIGSLAICTILYIGFTFVLVGLVYYPNLNVAAPVALAVDQTPFPWFASIIKIAILAGFTSVILVLLLGQSRIFFAMANDGLLPDAFAKVHPTYRTPWISQLILMIGVSAISGFAPIRFLGELTSIGTLLAFIFICLSVIILRVTHPEFKRPFKLPANPVIPVSGIIVCLVMMISLGIDTWIRLVIWSIVGLAIYFLYSRPHHKKISHQP